MPRSFRILYPGAVYHIMAWGNHSQPIYKDDQDRQRFLETLAKACEKTGWRVYAYVLMGNRYHLLISTPEGNLVEWMKWLPTPSGTMDGIDSGAPFSRSQQAADPGSSRGVLPSVRQHLH